MADHSSHSKAKHLSQQETTLSYKILTLIDSVKVWFKTTWFGSGSKVGSICYTHKHITISLLAVSHATLTY